MPRPLLLSLLSSQFIFAGPRRRGRVAPPVASNPEIIQATAGGTATVACTLPGSADGVVST